MLIYIQTCVRMKSGKMAHAMSLIIAWISVFVFVNCLKGCFVIHWKKILKAGETSRYIMFVWKIFLIHLLTKFLQSGYQHLVKSNIVWPILVNLMRTTCRLVKMNILSHIDPIRESVRKNSLISKFVIHCCQSLILIGWTSKHFMIVTNQKVC